MLSSSSLRSSTSRASRPAARVPAIAGRTAVVGWQSPVAQPSSTSQASAQYAGPRRKAVTMMGNKATGGPFSPLVVVFRNAIGEKDFNKFRGKAISIHSQSACIHVRDGGLGAPAPRVGGACLADLRQPRVPDTKAHPTSTPSQPNRPIAVIKDFCGKIGVDNKQAQGVIRLAKKNGEKLGFLA
jgi:hypothetical protein